MRTGILLLRTLFLGGSTAFIGILLFAVCCRTAAKHYDHALGTALYLTFGVLLLASGILGLLTGSMFTMKWGEIIAAKDKAPKSWALSNFLSVGLGVAFLLRGAWLLLYGNLSTAAVAM